MRHDKVCAHLQYSVCKAVGNEMADTGTHTCPSQCMNRKMLVLWNQAVHTNREVTKCGPDIIIKNKKKKTCILIDVAVPADRNVMKKETEKELKYKSLCTEIQ